MTDEVKQIRCWRIRAGSPCGVHLWFDPRVEHVVLLEGPVSDLPLVLGDEKVMVDSDPQRMLPWNGMLSMSDSGKREAYVELNESNVVEFPTGEKLDLPF